MSLNQGIDIISFTLGIIVLTKIIIINSPQGIIIFRLSHYTENFVQLTIHDVLRTNDQKKLNANPDRFKGFGCGHQSEKNPIKQDNINKEE